MAGSMAEYRPTWCWRRSWELYIWIHRHPWAPWAWLKLLRSQSPPPRDTCPPKKPHFLWPSTQTHESIGAIPIQTSTHGLYLFPNYSLSPKGCWPLSEDQMLYSKYKPISFCSREWTASNLHRDWKFQIPLYILVAEVLWLEILVLLNVVW